MPNEIRKKHRVKIRRNTKEFCVNFINQFQQAVQTLEGLGFSTKDFLPNVFQSENIAVDCIYSADKEHVLFLFKKSTLFNFNFNITYGDVINFLDPTGIWANSRSVAFRITNSVGINLKQCKIQGLKPFELSGNQIELIIENLELELPSKETIVLDYALIMSLDIFEKRLQSLTNYINDILFTYVDFSRTYGKKFDTLQSEATQYKQKLEYIRQKIEQYFFDEKTPERDIDQFLQQNPIVLEKCLNLINLFSQATLKDVLGKYGQDLKPDLIGFNINDKQWTIVDYKRAKRNIIKNVDTVRTTFKAEVMELQSQLRDYKEYFEEKEHRDYVLNQYNLRIEFPTTIGIIGNIVQCEERNFNRLKQDIPGWFKIVPYNYLYDAFSRYISTLNRIQ